jgi:hypothetical protein
MSALVDVEVVAAKLIEAGHHEAANEVLLTAIREAPAADPDASATTAATELTAGAAASTGTVIPPEEFRHWKRDQLAELRSTPEGWETYKRSLRALGELAKAHV